MTCNYCVIDFKLQRKHLAVFVMDACCSFVGIDFLFVFPSCFTFNSVIYSCSASKLHFTVMHCIAIYKKRQCTTESKICGRQMLHSAKQQSQLLCCVFIWLDEADCGKILSTKSFHRELITSFLLSHMLHHNLVNLLLHSQ